MKWKLERLHLYSIMTAALGFLLLSFSAPSEAASYTLNFTGNVTQASSFFSTLGIKVGDPVSGSFATTSFNTDVFTTLGSSHNFDQKPSSFTFHVAPSGAGDFDANAAGLGDIGSFATNVGHGLRYGIENATFTQGLFLTYTTTGSTALLSTLAGLPTTSSDIIAFLGGISPGAGGFFDGGSGEFIDFSVAFSSAATPIAAALPLFVSALGVLSFIAWRRARASVA